MKKLTSTLALALILGASGTLFAQDLQVTSTIHSTDASGAPARIQSDGSPYVSFKLGKNVVQSQLAGSEWELDTRTSTTRKVFIDFRDSAGGSGAPFQFAMLPVRFLSQCTQYYNVNLQSLGLAETRYCGLNFGFAYGGAEYGVRMRPHLFPGTTDVAWQCTSFASGRCNAWEATPYTVQGDGSVKAIGQLYKKATKRGETDVILGNFYFTFRVTLTAP